MSVYIANWAADGSDLFYQYLEDPTTGPQRLEETPARVLLLLRFLDIGTGKTSIQDFHLTIAEVWDLFHMLDRYAVKGYYRTLFKTILHDPNSILDITGQVSHMRPMIDWSILALGMPPEERAALVFKLRMVAHELRLGMLWNRLRLYTTSKIEVPEIVRQELLPEYLDVVVRVLTVLKVASRLQLHYDTDLVLVGYSDAYAYKMYLSIGNGEVVHRF